ncbi:MAG: hypothetical protein CVU06_10755 [Bacteroidetes bacterium HGW-Bacteroidetes-22]|nr:MAG: hypothetical protein CVU06_10755 [Bacteroidetes bacterium HGW-Bacteroidetes-22]
MEETKRLFSQRAITIATFLGGPAAAGYLVKKNYEAFDQSEKGKIAFIIGIISTLLIFAGIFSMPEHIIDKIPNVLIPAIYTGIIYSIVEKIQGQWLREHKESGGKFYSVWKATGIGAIFMTILLAMIAGTAFLAGDLSRPDFDSTTYDNEVAKFVENENKSLAVYKVINSAEPQFLIKEFSKGIVLWKENIEIVNRLNAIENLPTELLEQNKKLLSYCDLRIQHNEIIVKAISEDTDKYVSEIDRIGMKINKVLEELEELKK